MLRRGFPRPALGPAGVRSSRSRHHRVRVVESFPWSPQATRCDIALRSYGRWKPWKHCILAGFEPCAARPRPGGRPTLAAPAPACAACRELSLEPSSNPLRCCFVELRALETLETLHFGRIRTLRGPPSARRASDPRGPGTSVCGPPRAFLRALDRRGATLRCGDSFIFHSPGWEVIYSNSKKEPCCPALRGGPGRPGSPPGCQA